MILVVAWKINLRSVWPWLAAFSHSRHKAKKRYPGMVEAGELEPARPDFPYSLLPVQKFQLQFSRVYYDRSSIAEKEKLQVLRPLQYCKEQETAITTTAPLLQREGNCNYYDRSRIAEKEKLQLLQPLQYCRERNCNHCDPSSIAEREKLELLRPLQYCRDRNCTYSDPSSMADRGIAITYCDRSSIAERYVYGDPTTIALVSGMTPWIVEGPEPHTRALTPPHAFVYRRVCVGSNPPSQPAPRPPWFVGLRFACGGGFVSGFFQGGLGHIVPRSPYFWGNRA